MYPLKNLCAWGTRARFFSPNPPRSSLLRRFRFASLVSGFVWRHERALATDSLFLPLRWSWLQINFLLGACGGRDWSRAASSRGYCGCFLGCLTFVWDNKGSRRSYRNFLLMRSRPCLVDLFSDLPQLCRWRRLSRALVLRLPFFFSNLISVSSFFMLLSGGRRCLTVMEASSVAPSLCVPACVTTKADLWRVAEVSLRLRQV